MAIDGSRPEPHAATDGSTPRAMLFAAGLGTRLKPLTDLTPKPLVKLRGKPLIEYSLERLCRAGCERIVVNTHHHAAQLEAYLHAHPAADRIVISREPVLLETGGGIVAALAELGEQPFLSVNSDAFCLDGERPALSRLAEAFDPERMDALLLLVPLSASVGYSGNGDFALTPEQTLRRVARPDYVFSGYQVLHPRLFRERAATPFSLREIYRAAERGDGTLTRMHGLVHDAAWLHVGTVAELRAAERFLEQSPA
jgi:MurNAc alpha-1-phosphate uridylyltransferase